MFVPNSNASSNKKLLETSALLLVTSATLVVTGALLVVTRLTHFSFRSLIAMASNLCKMVVGARAGSFKCFKASVSFKERCKRECRVRMSYKFV